MPKLWIEVDYQLGDTLYLKTDPDQALGIITGIMIREGGRLIYEFSVGPSAHWVTGMELSKEKNSLNVII